MLSFSVSLCVKFVCCLVQISDSQELVGELEDMDVLLSEYENDPVYHAKAKVSHNALTWDVVHQSML